ncbi:MAG TPA: NAD(P)/FAD-dependent oxidoreductase [Puia sp.]
MPKRAIIIGAGPAGLTAAYELLKRTDIIPVILEKSGDIGGISKTINYKGNRMDMGPHRFFSKSDRVMDWWLKIMPLETNGEQDIKISYQNKSREIKPVDADATSIDPKDPDKKMLVIHRLTRIYFLRKFFAYPIQLGFDTLKTLGLIRTIRILISFFVIKLFPRKPEKSLEDFIINKFGRQLYLLFFKDYTEKVWGVPCHEISAEWGAQRIKGVSLSKAIAHAIQNLRPKKKAGDCIGQKGTETSLIEQFLYPKHGPGSLWEEVARQVQEMGGKIYFNRDVQKIDQEDHKITAIATINNITGQTGIWEGDYFFSTMPVKELIAGMEDAVPVAVKEIAAGLQYRDFINVGILLRQLSAPGKVKGKHEKLELKDNWIYIQERDVKVGRLMIYNNWGGGMIKDPTTVWIGMEYFCNKTDTFWQQDDETIKTLAIMELEKMGLAKSEDVLDSTVRRMEKTYPAYFGTYGQFDKIREYTDQFHNLFLVGRNGMHKYNNSDHSMLTAMVAVDNICEGITAKTNLWAINTEQEYHEEKPNAASEPQTTTAQKLPKEASTPTMVAKQNALKDYLLNHRLNRTFLWIAGIAIIVQFVIFKILYPYAGFINGDSYVYLESAYMNYDINTYPVGYSKFLRLFSVFSRSDTALVAFQYLIIQCSALYFIFTLFYFYKPGKLTKWLLLLFVVFNPVFLYLSNYVSSDALFLALSLLWFTQLLWIIQRSTTRLILLQAVLLLVAFTVRHNALYYPLIATLAFLLSRQPVWRKVAGIAASILVVASFILYTSNRYQEYVGIRQFTPFTGWQMANNALYAYRYVDSQHVKKPPARFRQLDKMVRTYFDTARDVKKHPEEMLVASTVYMWDSRSPLQKYMNSRFKKDSMAGTEKRWASMAPLYADYGVYLIRQYPLQFAEHYLWPNALKYYTPPGEFLETYNAGSDSVQQIAQAWFGYKSNKVKSAFKDFNVSVLDFFPILAGIMNVVFLSSFLCFIILKGFRGNPVLSGTLLLAAGLWITNFGFSVFAAPIALRYQVFPILIFSSFALLLIDYIYKAASVKAM